MSPYLTSLLIAPPGWLSLPAAALFALGAWAMRWLTPTGAASTFIVGLVIFGLGGGKFAVPLLVFFLTSSLLSKLGRARKEAAGAPEAKGSTRDAGQVWANGGVATIMVLLFAYFVARWPVTQSRALLVFYMAALATVNADTWATEIGKLSGARPRSLRTGQPVPPGESGAVSWPGTLAALAGAAVIPLSVLGLWRLTPTEFFVAFWAGFLGCFVDSLLGASIQAQYRDPVMDTLTERPEVGGQRTMRVRGLPFVTNDVVNFLASAAGTGAAWFLLRYASA